MAQIAQKVEQVEQGLMQPMVIFPEGTTTNGKGMMKSKKGVFLLEKPFWVYGLMYDSDFVPCLDMIKPLPSFFIMYSSPVNRL